MTLKNFRISKGGRLLGDKWNPEERSWEENKDFTEQYLVRLDEECLIEEGVILKDVLQLLENINAYPILSPMLTNGPWLADIVQEGMGVAKEQAHVDEIRLRWGISIEEDDDGPEINACIYASGYSDKDDERWAIGYSPINTLAQCRISLEYKTQIIDERNFDPKNYPVVILEANKKFTLKDILFGLFWELSFHGGPKDRDKVVHELEETIERIRSGEEETIPWEDIRFRWQNKEEEEE